MLANLVHKYLGSEWCGTISAPTNGLQERYLEGRDFEGHDLEWFYETKNDAHELWIGSAHKWYWYTNRRGARKLAWFIFKWHLLDWFGIRRYLWYWALRKKVKSYGRKI